MSKSTQLQIRVTEEEKAAIQKRAQLERLDVSAWVLKTLLPPAQDRFAQILDSKQGRQFILAELNDFLTALSASGFIRAVELAPSKRLDPEMANYVAAMVEHAASQKNVSPPAWVQTIKPLKEPLFASSLKNLRLHLLLSSPVPFRRRNIFVDSSTGDRL